MGTCCSSSTEVNSSLEFQLQPENLIRRKSRQELKHTYNINHTKQKTAQMELDNIIEEEDLNTNLNTYNNNNNITFISTARQKQNKYMREKHEMTKYEQDIAICIVNNTEKYEKKSKFIKISYMYVDSLWNLVKFYYYDYQSCKYIIYDLRKEKEVGFLSHFKRVSYSIKEMKKLTNDKLEALQAYYMFKKIIIIGDLESILVINEFIDYLYENEVYVEVVFLKEDINLQLFQSEKSDFSIKNRSIDMQMNNQLNVDTSIYNTDNSQNQYQHKNFLYKTINQYGFKYLPYILLPMKYFSEYNSEKYIFINIEDSYEKQVFNSILYRNNENDRNDNQIFKNILSFLYEYDLKGVVEFSISDKNQKTLILNNKIEFKRKVNLDVSQLNENNEKSVLVNNSDLIKKTINETRLVVSTNKSLLVDIDSRLSKENQLYIILVLIYKYTNLKVNEVYNNQNNYSFKSFFEIHGYDHVFKIKHDHIEDMMNKYIYSNENRCLIHHKKVSSTLYSKNHFASHHIDKSTNIEVGIRNKRVIQVEDNLKTKNSIFISNLSKNSSQFILEPKYQIPNIVQSVSNSVPIENEDNIKHNSKDLYLLLLNKLKSDIPNYSYFISIVNIINKVLINIINDPNEIKYRKINFSSVFSHLNFNKENIYILLHSFGYFPIEEENIFFINNKDSKRVAYKKKLFDEAVNEYLNN